MSILWKHFSDEGSEKVKCKYCSIVVSYKKGNRSIMRKHLERKHPEALGITTQAMTQDTFMCTDDEQTMFCTAEIHPIFQIESNIQYFIQMVYQRPTLYEYSRFIGWNSKQNKIIWQEVADTFQVDITDCQKFWKYLKETYDLHSRNPKLDDHKYAKELSFLGEMYKKRRQRKEDLAKQRKLLKIVENESFNNFFLENNSTDKDTQFLISGSEEDINNLERKKDGSLDYVVNYDIGYVEENDHPYAESNGDFNGFIMKDSKAEDIVVFDGDSSLIEPSNIISLVNASTQTNHTGQISNNHSYNPTEHKTSPTKCKKCSNDFDELDLLMEFIKGKIRKFPIKDMNKLQIKILKTVMDAEKDTKFPIKNL